MAANFDYTFKEYVDCDNVKITDTDETCVTVRYTYKDAYDFAGKFLLPIKRTMTTASPAIRLYRTGTGVNVSKRLPKCYDEHYDGYSDVESLLQDLARSCCMHSLEYYAKTYLSLNLSDFTFFELSLYNGYMNTPASLQNDMYSIIADWFKVKRDEICMEKAYLRDDSGKKIRIVLTLETVA